MVRIFRSKLMPPADRGYLARPRLLSGDPGARLVVAQAPGGAGKTVLLGQWLQARGGPAVYYELDEQDRDGAVFTAHLLAGLQCVWAGWNPPGDLDPGELAVELVSEAGGRPDLTLVLDGLEHGFGQPYLADFLAVLLRYAPSTLTVGLATRAPLPVDPESARFGCRRLLAADLAFTREEAAALLGPGGWEECYAVSGGLPMALRMWQQAPAGWRAAAAARSVAAMPPQMAPDAMRALVDEWLAGGLPLASFAHQVSCAQPGADRLWREVEELRQAFGFDPRAVLGRARALWDTVHGRGDRGLAGPVALLIGETHCILGEYGDAMEWYRRAFEIDPQLELLSANSKVMLLRDQGHMEEAEALSRRCVAACMERGDLQALTYAHMYYGAICMELGRLDEAEAAYLEAERAGRKLAGEPLLGTLATIHRAMLNGLRGNMTAYRQLAEEAYGSTRGRWPYAEAMCAHVLAIALLLWGEKAAAERLLHQSLDALTRFQSKWHMHVALTCLARVEWADGRTDAARAHFDQALALAAREGYTQYLQTPRARTLPLILDALLRGAEPAQCQELLARMGERALPDLLDLSAQPDPGSRRAVIYPLAAIGGEQAVAAIRRLAHDPDESVRDAALLALQSLGSDRLAAPAPAPPPAAPAPRQPAPGAVTGEGLSVAILGPAEVHAGGRKVSGWRTAKARDLLAYLVLSGDRPVSRDQIIEALWPEAGPEAGTSALHTALYHLRRALGPGAESAVTFAGGAYRFDRESADVDLDRFQRLATAGNPDGWRQAITLYRGDLLEGLDYPWCEGPRTRARSQYLDTLRRLGEYLRQARRWGEATPVLQLLVQVDPLAEDGHQALMECYAALGNRSAALQQYRTLARLLDDELGLTPSSEAQELYKRLIE
ncbi:MAG TPA: BTAD domain-containing putative transcriptional regulator [Symbiobacteriaceae bacterium]|nr:BTAD domain-containing putative transcriptional regulator [Symbiobacteriaceae bacterium]